MGLFSGLGSLLGMGGDQGEHYKAKQLENKGTKSLAEMLDAARGVKVNDAGKSLMGGKSLQEVLAGLNGDEMAGLASSPIYGSNVAQQQVMSDPLLSGLFNKGGSRDMALDEERRLSSQGFKLTSDDHEAYGQASGDIARMFGQQEQSLASALADRGLATGGSGAAGAQFTGLQGNKNEQLAKMQMQIANQRMENTKARLADTRSYSLGLAGLGQDAENSAFNRNMTGANSRTSLASDLAGQTRGDYSAQAAQDQAEMESKLANKKKNLGDALANGLYAGVQGGAQSFTEGVMGGNAKTAMGPMSGMPSGGGAPSGYSVGSASGMYGKRPGSF